MTYLHCCPRCSSTAVTSNRLDGIYVDRFTHVAQAVQSIGIPRLSIVAALGLGLLSGANALRKECRCLDCGFKFDAQ